MEAARLIPYDLRNSSFTREGWRFWAMPFAREKRRLVDFRWTSASESLFLIFLPLSSARLVFFKKVREKIYLSAKTLSFDHIVHLTSQQRIPNMSILSRRNVHLHEKHGVMMASKECLLKNSLFFKNPPEL